MSTENRDHQILLIGLPGAGKTSFLAALWQMVDQQSVQCGLSVQALKGDRKYLNQIRDAWLEYRAVPRNKLDVETFVSMDLRDSSTGKPVKLAFPDLSGESFKLQWTKRQLTTGYEKLLHNGTGFILFIHPERIQKPHRIDMLTDLECSIGSTPVVTPVSIRRTEVPWDGEKTPTQVQLVELLQILAPRCIAPHPLRLAIVVSAWDLLSAVQISPDQFVERELPFLHQFLKGNSDTYIVEHYGVSAQGGRYASPRISGDCLTNPTRFLAHLQDSTNLLSSSIWKSFTEETQKALVSTQDHEKIRQTLGEALNTAVALPSFFNEQLFENVSLRPITAHLLDQWRNKLIDMTNDGVRLNRLLLEDAFPEDLSREWEFQAEHQVLENKNPARRVRVAGRRIDNHSQHDITEPIRWLID